MNLLPALAYLCLVASTFGAPQNYGWPASTQSLKQGSLQQYQNIQPYNNFNTPNVLFWNGQAFIDNPYQNGQTVNNPFQVGRVVSTPSQPIQNIQVALQPIRTAVAAPLGLTVDFDSSFGSFPLSALNELTPAQRGILLPVMESLLRVMETDKPSVEDVNTLMIQVRDLLKTVPEGRMPDLKQYGFDIDSIGVGMDLDTLKNVALPETGDIAITEDGEEKIVTGFGKFSLKSLMTDSERKQFLPVVRGFTNLLRKDVLDPTETKELLAEVRKLDSWNLFPFDVRQSNEPKRKKGFGTTFNIGALSGLISGLMNAMNSESFF